MLKWKINIDFAKIATYICVERFAKSATQGEVIKVAMLELDLELIRSKRLELEIPLQEMSDALGLKNASSYFKYEKGDYKFNADHLPIVCTKLGLNMNEVFFDRSVAKTAN